MQFRLIHLFAFTGWCAVTFALHRLHPLAAVLACPVLLGPWSGHRVSQSPEGALLGLLSAFFWLLAALLFYLIVGHFFLISSSPRLPGDPLSIWIFSASYLFFALTSCVGGYVGGRIAMLY